MNRDLPLVGRLTKAPFVYDGLGILHPFLLALYPVTSLVISNGAVYTGTEILLVVGASLLVAVAIFLGLDSILGHPGKAGLLTSLVIVLLADYSFFDTTLHHDSLSSLVSILNLDRHRYRIGLYAVSVSAIAAYVLLTKRSLRRTTQSANVASLVLLTVAIGQHIWAGTVLQGGPSAFGVSLMASTDQTAHISRGDDPDIFYVILDRYANDAVLEQYLRYDNSAFSRSLTARGFYIARNSVANYPGTLRSVASSLNMNYLERYLPSSASREAADSEWSVLYQDNAVVQVLKERGYRYLHFGSYWTPTFANRHADYTWNPLKVSSSLLLNHLFVRSVVYPVRLRRFLDTEAPDAFQAVAAHSVDAGPKFVFAHILLPHPPFLFSRDGERASFGDNATAYIQQLRFATTKALALVAAVQERETRPYVFILQSDEGPYSRDLFRSQEDADRHLSQEQQIEVHGRILYALYAPRISMSQLHQELTPINTFRLVFNAYFNSGFEILEDRNWVPADASAAMEGTGGFPFIPRLRDASDQFRGAER